MKISKQNAQHYYWGDLCGGWHLLKNEQLHILHEKMLPDTQKVRHCHQVARRFFFALTSKAQIAIEGKTYTFKPQEGIGVPPLASHRMMNHSEADTEFLAVSSPGSHATG